MRRLRALCLVVLLAFPLLASADQAVRVEAQKTITLNIAGATAAFSLDGAIAEAQAVNGQIEIFGRAPGETNIAVVTSLGTQHILVTVSQPKSIAVAVASPAESLNGESGTYTFNIDTDPLQVFNSIDVRRVQGDSETRLQFASSSLLSAHSSGSFGFPLLAYTVRRGERSVIAGDQTLAVSPLTVDQSQVRGLHLQQGEWTLHAGFTSLATFQNLLLATDPEQVYGLSRTFALNRQDRLTFSSFYFMNPTRLQAMANDGSVNSVKYQFHPTNAVRCLAEAAVGKGVATAANCQIETDKLQLKGDYRIEPARFASLALNNRHGTFLDQNATYLLNSRVTLAGSVSQADYNMAGFRQNTFVSDLTARFRLDRHFSVSTGNSVSLFSSRFPVGPPLHTVILPVGIDFSTRHFGSGFDFNRTVAGQGAGSNGFGSNVSGNARGFQGTFYWRRDRQVPSLEQVLAQVPALQDLLTRSGAVATSLSDIAALLNNVALLSELGLTQPVSVNLAPLRTQFGSSLTWNGSTPGRQQISVAVQSTRTQLISGTDSIFDSLTVGYVRRLGRADNLVANMSFFRSGDAGVTNVKPAFHIGLQHHLGSVPQLLLPGKHGTIEGHVFADDAGAGAFDGNIKSVLAGVEVKLDSERTTHTDARGFYSFAHVPYGTHRVEAFFHSDRPFFYTTDSPAETAINSVVDFGVSFARAQIVGYLRSDANTGIGSIAVELVGAHGKRRTDTASDGRFEFAELESGEYTVSPLPDSFPPGYSLQRLTPAHVSASPAASAHVEFQVRAMRSVTGKVTRYDPEVQREVPVAGATIQLVGTDPRAPIQAMSAADGTYLLRSLAAGAYEVRAEFNGQSVSVPVTLADTPVALRDIDLHLGR